MVTKRTAWNKGKPLPHNPEWEAKRLEAVRAAAKRKNWPKGYRRPKEHTQPMLKALRESRKSDPERHRRISIANLPKTHNGAANPNWKGGITARTRGMRFSREARIWRRTVLQRDGHKCRVCGATSGLHAHHIIPISECAIIAWVPMNGVTLCKDCHYREDEAWRGKRFKQIEVTGKPLALIFTIPHRFQAYPTVGNWQFTKDGTIVIFVSRLSNPRREALVAIHELVEVILCEHDGVTQEAVDDFDKAYEAARPEGDESEPGDDLRAPYRAQHCFATGIERLLAARLGVSWGEYEEELEQLP